MDFKYLGAGIMVLSVFLALIVYNISSELLASIDMGDHCSSVTTCPHVATISLSYVGYLFSASLFSMGAFIYKKSPQSAIRRKPGNLDPEEKKIYEILAESDGMLFQGDIIEKSGFSKVKVTRLLDRMEAKKVLERRRRGMSNAVVLK